jgi:two-component system chemotaxis sensor kinase CheA
VAEGADPNLLQDFLTESGELVEMLDADLVKLESDPDSRMLLDGIFRALHTIKGAASFLSLPEITTFAHASEDALNRLRKGEAEVNAQVIDALLRSVDVVKGMLGELGTGVPITPGPDDLVHVLHQIAEGKIGAVATAVGGAGSVAALPAAPAQFKSEFGPFRPLVMSSEKADLLPGMRDECRAAAAACEAAAALAKSGDIPTAAARIEETRAALVPTVEYFGFEGLLRLIEALPDHAENAPSLRAASRMLAAFAAGIEANQELAWTDDDVGRFLAEGAPDQAHEPAASAPAIPEPAAEKKPEPRPDGKPDAKGDAKADTSAESTVRVEVARLESLLNLVGELVLTKNQVMSIARQLRGLNLAHDVLETVTGVSGQLDRLTSELQVGVMRTRMQPLSKLFGRYPRVVRDLARVTGKQIDIQIFGGDTEVDKGVLEALADPMVHILRNSADHGIEMPEARVNAGKSPEGTIRVSAEHRGGHVRVEIADDGKGIDPEVIGPKAVEKGVITPEQLSGMSPQEIVNLIFAAGFSTAEKVSDLSGRGVGMDVVRTNIQKLGGNVSITSFKGKGTAIEVLIPLTVAILPAMMVGVGKHQYAVPLASVVEIVRLSDTARHTVAGKAVMRLREQVLPLIDMPARLGDERAQDGKRFAVVVEVGQQRAGLIVDDLVGQQEVVIKPLDDSYTAGGPFSGATIREDGDVSLIIDATALIRGVHAESASS